jgi:PKD repeat protein
VVVNLTNLGLSSPRGTLYLLDRSHGDILTESVSLHATSTGYAATIDVPAYSTVALSLKGDSAGEAPKAVLKVSTTSGTHPLTVTVDTSASTGGSSAIAGRTTSFGDGSWLSWYSSAPHLYSKPGKYFIGVTVTNESGQYSSTGTTITVY